MTSHSRIAVIDPSVGAAGDMFLGALLALGVEESLLVSLPSRLGLAESVGVSVSQVQRASLDAVRVIVRVNGEHERASPHAHHPHGHNDHQEQSRHIHVHHGHDPDGGGHSHSHRHVGEILARIDRGQLSSTVKAKATEAFRLLAEAEARVHGVNPEHVSLHEVGAWDAVIDIVGTVEGFEHLGVGAIYHTPIAVGEGWVSAAHGAMPVPAPATGALVEGLLLRTDGPARGEALTPTGAALLRVLSLGSPPPIWRALGQGWGAGDRNPPDYANALRIWIGERCETPATMHVVTADMDDMPLEYLEPLRAALADAGAVDVQAWATLMKKGRVGLRLEAQCVFSKLGAVTEAFFRHGTTAGVRHYPVERTVLGRREVRVEVAGQTVRVKVLEGPEGLRFKPEYDDVTAVARRIQMSALAVAQRAHDLARANAGAGTNEELR